MAIFCCAYSLNHSPLPDGISQHIVEALCAAGTPIEVRNSHTVLTYVELGIWHGSSVIHTKDICGVVAGDPVYCPEDKAIGRQFSIETVVQSVADGNYAVLAQAEGTYCGVVFDIAHNRLLLLVDKLAIRPIYYTVSKGVMYASNALWVLETISDVEKQADWQGVTEIAAFGYSLSNRTAYQGIMTIGIGELVECNETGISVQQYWNWNKLTKNNLQEDELVNAVELSFNRAVDDRIEGQQHVVAFLSGGMDSRLLVACLRSRDIFVDTLNFAPDGSQDLLFGKLAAEAMQTRHFEYPTGISKYSFRQIEAIDAWRNFRQAAGNALPERHRLLWSGD